MSNKGNKNQIKTTRDAVSESPTYEQILCVFSEACNFITLEKTFLVFIQP